MSNLSGSFKYLYWKNKVCKKPWAAFYPLNPKTSLNPFNFRQLKWSYTFNITKFGVSYIVNLPLNLSLAYLTHRFIYIENCKKIKLVDDRWLSDRMINGSNRGYV